MAEIALGVSALAAVGYFWLKRGDDLFTETYVPSAAMAVFCLILPGWWLRSSSSTRWLGQLIPLVVFGWAGLIAYGMSRW